MAADADEPSERQLMKRVLLAFALFLGFELAADRPATAQAAWPTRQVTFVIAFAPGGPADIVGRIMADRLQQMWGQPVVVENRGGAGGSIATRQVAKSEPNGTQVLVNTSAYSVTPSLSENAGYSPELELRTAVIAATGPNLVVAAPNLKAATLKEVMELARIEPLSFGTAGPGTTPHLSGERLFKEFGKVDVRHAPFTGSGPALNALLGSHVPLGVMSLAGVLEHVGAGRVQAIAITAAKRLKSLPNVPTAIEAGYGDGEEATWVAFMVPAATPEVIADKINSDVNALLMDVALLKRLEQIGLMPVGGTRKEASDYVKRETEKWAGVIKKLGLRVD